MSKSHPPPSVFLSYARADSLIVDRLRTDLHTQEIATWVDREGIQPGTPDWEEALRTAIRGARAVLLVATPNARSSRYVKDELRIAQMYQRPIYPLWMTGTQWMEAIPLGLGGTQYIDAREERYASAFSEIVAVLKEVPFATTSSTATASLSEPEPKVESRNPYKGLRAFTPMDTDDFFGRDALIQELQEALKTLLETDTQGVQSVRLLAVIGPSGSGKSSVVMAGLLPCLQAGGILDSKEWVYLDPIVPGTHPIESLTLALSEKLREKSLKTIREDLEDDSARSFHLYATALAKPQGSKLVLFVDQFEELFTLTPSEDERRQFVDLLLNAITEPRGPVVLILTLRADFIDRPMQYPELYRLIDVHHCSVLPMEMADLRSVITQPATLPDVQLTFEGDLVGDLLFEMRGQSSALPLLQFTLDQLFQRRNGHRLTLESYREIGGVKGALAKQAEATYVALPSEEHRRLARALFLRLIDPGATEQDTTRRRAALTEFSLIPTMRSRLLRDTIEVFTTARLLTTNTVAGVPTVEVSHEALIREWVRLSDWLREAREDVRLQQAISEDVVEWERRGKPRDRLYRGSQLKEARAWARSNTPSSIEMAFLGASAQQRIRSRVNVLAILLLLTVMVGVAVQLLRLSLSVPTPTPTYVTNLNDDGAGSLRQAIDLASPGSTITFASMLRGTIVLATNDLYITKNLTIRGPGAGILAISDDGNPFSIQVLAGATVSFFGLTFKKSQTLQNSFIDNSGNLTFANSIVTANIGPSGAINNSGTLTLTNSMVSDNFGSSSGGIDNSGTLTVTNSTISGNNGYGSGGINNSGTLTVTNSTISGNSAFGKGGGGINNSGNTATITNSTVSSNMTFGEGGGIDNSGAIGSISAIDITNSTISDNKAADGGGLAFSNSIFLIDFCTIYGNTSVKFGGGIFSLNNFYSFGNGIGESINGIGESIVAGNHAHTDSNISGVIVSKGYNLFQNVSSSTIHYFPGNTHSTDMYVPTSTNLRIDSSLRKNGGPTQTLALLSGSPAIDRIPLDACVIFYAIGQYTRNTSDQRGVKRPQGNGCDIGAYEYQPSS